MKKNQRSLLKFLLAVLSVVAAVFLIYIWQERLRGSNRKPAIICPTASIRVSVESLSDNSILLRDVTAMDVEDGDITGSLVVESVSQFVEKDHCIVTYAAFDSDNNVSKLTRHLFLTDYVPPRFTISAPLEFGYSSSFNPLANVGAYDCIDGDISDRVKMVMLNPDDDITAIGKHAVQYRVTNSLGDVSVLDTEVEIYERTYTESRMIPSVRLTDYIVYVDRYGYVDPEEHIAGITLGGVPFAVAEYRAGSIEIDDSEVDYSTPGYYRIRYTCDNRQEYYGEASLIVCVTEVDG
ncbi:MAG: hypothetical protein II536_00530 [Clostridia bacterium]|nr:hypothetical protein [Clostridia bacterium]